MDSHSPLLGPHLLPNKHKKRHNIIFLCFLLLFVAFTIVGLAVRGNTSFGILKRAEKYNEGTRANQGDVIESEVGVVAADDARCSAVGVSMLRLGGHAVDAAVATALCLGVVFSASSGIGGGSFMVVRSSSTSKTQAFDMRETAPSAASQVLNILDSYGDTPDAVKGNLGTHRLIEALKHMFAVRMNLGDPDFENISATVSEMLSPSFAQTIQHKILDNTTFPPDYYMNRWGQLRDHGTSHLCVVDADRNAVSLTTSVNYHFGAGVRSTSTGIVINNQMDDFSTPTEISPEKLPPAPTNFIEPNKRPLSSMTPIIITKDDQLVGVIGGSGGMNIISAVTQVFLNHFILGMQPLDAVLRPRVYTKLIPDVVCYENLTAHDGDHIELSEESKLFLEERGHQLRVSPALAVTQLIVQTLKTPISSITNRKTGEGTGSRVNHGTLTAVSDPRKGGCPAAV